MDLIEDHSYFQYFNTDPYGHTNNSEHMSIIQQHRENTSHNSSHYMSSKPATNNNKPQQATQQQQSHLNSSINQPYSMNINSPLSPMSSSMLHSSPIMPPIDQNTINNNHQVRFCKNASTTSLNHYETTPLPTYHQTNIQNHHSPSPNRTDLNHFNENVTIANTLTDNSNSCNYVSTGPQASQSMAKHQISKNINMVSTAQTYSPMNCRLPTDWNPTMSSHNNSQRLKNSNTNNQMNYNIHQEEHCFSYLEPRNSEYLSMPSNNLSPQTTQKESSYLIKSKNLEIKPEQRKNEKNITSIVEDCNKTKSLLTSDFKASDTKKKMVEKRHIIIFKIIEQLIDPETKNIIKENVTKNDEVVISLGLTSQDNNSTSQSCADKSKNLNQSLEYYKDIPAQSVESNIIDDMDSKSKSDNNNNNVIPIEIKANNETENEDKERGAASALLSLQTANTPVKKVESDPLSYDLKLTANSNQKNNDEEQITYIGRLKPGFKIMAKWKDKNFYPAETVKQNETHKWMVKFEDMATRNLFESEIIRIEHLIHNQEVMVKISEELFKISSIKKIIKTNDNKNYEFDLEHFGDDEKTKIIKRYPLKDIFLYAEQGTNILNKVSKPNSIGAVFADVDLDNIVSGKRARSKKLNAESSNKKSKTQCNDNNFTSNKKNKTIDNEKSNKEDIFHKSRMSKIVPYSLTLSPCPAKSIASTIPKNELDKIFGPIPKPGSKLFHNISFILTCSHKNNQNLLESDDSNAECSTPFDKGYLVKQIISGNGKVYNNFDEMMSSSNGNCSECICIADTYSRSIKFIQCLAAGISIVSYQWIIECCRQNRTLDRNSYILPAGYSIITNALSSDKNTFKKSSSLFRGVKFYFGSEHPDKLYELCSPVLKAAQSIIITQDPNIHNTLQRGQIDIIIGDSSCPSVLITKAKQLKIPIVSIEYVVQCLINGRKLSYDASPLFSFNSTN